MDARLAAGRMSADPAALRVASYNIRHGVGTDGRLDLLRTAAAIAALGADVIGLQEVDDTFGQRSAYEDQAARLAEMLGLQVCFGATIDQPPAGGRERRRRYGLALLSRHEITGHELHLLPGHPARPAPREARGVLQVRLVPPGWPPLDVLVTHLDNEDREHRLAQILRIVRRGEELDGPAVLLGDMNADPSAPELAPLAATGWRDAAIEDGAGTAPRGSASRLRASSLFSALPLAPRARRATFPARRPLRRLDSIWLRGTLRAGDVVVARTRASDHRPVVATIHRLDGEGTVPTGTLRAGGGAREGQERIQR